MKATLDFSLKILLWCDFLIGVRENKNVLFQSRRWGKLENFRNISFCCKTFSLTYHYVIVQYSIIRINETWYLINSQLSNWLLVSVEILLHNMSLNHFSGVFDEVEQLLLRPNHTAHACCTGSVFKADFLICQAPMLSVVDIPVSTVACKCLTEQCAICNTTQLCYIYLKAGFFTWILYNTTLK